MCSRLIVLLFFFFVVVVLKFINIVSSFLGKFRLNFVYFVKEKEQV